MYGVFDLILVLFAL